MSATWSFPFHLMATLFCLYCFLPDLSIFSQQSSKTYLFLIPEKQTSLQYRSHKGRTESRQTSWYSYSQAKLPETKSGLTKIRHFLLFIDIIPHITHMTAPWAELFSSMIHTSEHTCTSPPVLISGPASIHHSNPGTVPQMLRPGRCAWDHPCPRSSLCSVLRPSPSRTHGLPKRKSLPR